MEKMHENEFEIDESLVHILRFSRARKANDRKCVI